MLVGYFHAKVGKVTQLDDGIELYATKKNANGVKTLKFLKNNEIKTLNNRVQKSDPPQWIWSRLQGKDKKLLS